MLGYFYGVTPVQFKQNLKMEDSTQASVSSRSSEKSSQSEFERLIKAFDQVQETDAERAARKAREEKEAQIRHEKIKRSNDLESRIIRARSKMLMNRHDLNAKAELSMAQTQLSWLKNAL